MRLFSSVNAMDHRNICILQQEDNSFLRIDRELSDSLSLPIVGPAIVHSRDQEQHYTHCLCTVPYTDGDTFSINADEQYAVAIQPLSDASSSTKAKRKKKSSLPKPFWIDLCPGNAGKRSGQPDLLLQAVAPKKAVVYDMTAGWGQDSLQLALGGAQKVHMVERDPIVACLLQDALRRVNLIAQSTITSPWQERATKLSQILTMQKGDSRETLKELIQNGLDQSAEMPDIIYLDPMFPPRTKTAAVKKNMQILHVIADVGKNGNVKREEEEAELLHLACKAAQYRVVVKRPVNAAEVGNDSSAIKPSHRVKGSINRWDIYVTKRHSAI
jgi:16S rRNA (guanine1516-N2)-methyltransferase